MNGGKLTKLVELKDSRIRNQLNPVKLERNDNGDNCSVMAKVLIDETPFLVSKSVCGLPMYIEEAQRKILPQGLCHLWRCCVEDLFKGGKERKFWEGKGYEGWVENWGLECPGVTDEFIHPSTAVQGDGSRDFSSLNRPVPIWPTTQLVGRHIRRQDLDKPHPMNPGTPAKSPNVANH